MAWGTPRSKIKGDNEPGEPINFEDLRYGRDPPLGCRSTLGSPSIHLNPPTDDDAP